MALRIGDSAPDFNLRGVDGEDHSLNSFTNSRILAVMFTCNHCPYVQAVEDRLIDIQRDYQAKGVSLVAINPNDEKKYPEDSFDEMVKRAARKGYNFPYLRDLDQKTTNSYGTEVTPEIFVFDQDRKLSYHGRVDDSKDPSQVKSKDMRNALDALLEGKEPPVTEAKAFGCSVKWLD